MSGLLLGLGTSYIGRATGAYITAAVRGNVQDANRRFTNELPGIEAVISLYNRGQIDDQTFRLAMASQGCEWPGPLQAPVGGVHAGAGEVAPPQPTLNAQLWQTLVETEKALWPAEQYRLWFRQGRLQLADIELRSLLQRMGFKSSYQQDLFIWATNPLAAIDLNELLRRGIIKPEQWRAGMRIIGWTADPDIDRLNMLATKQLPGFGSVIQWASSYVYDDNLAGRLGLDDRYGQWYQAQMKQYGRAWDNDGPVDKYSMRAAMQTPGPGQATQFLFRLRPSRIGRWAGVVNDLKAFTDQDVKDILTRSGFPDRFIPQLTAMGYAMPRIQFVRRAVTYGFMTKAESVQQYEDRGFLPDDANTMANLDQQAKYEHDNRWAVGQMEQSKARLGRCILQALDVGVLDPVTADGALAHLGVTTAARNRLISAVDICQLTAIARETIRVIRRAYLSGEINATEAGVRLVQATVQPNRINEYLTLWAIQLSTHRRQLSTGQILSAVKGGFMTPQVAALRLTNLGWVNPDELILIAQAESAFIKAQAKQLAAMQPKIPLSELKKFVKDGIISPEDLALEMQKRNYPTAYIAATILDLTKVKAKPAPKPAPGKRGPTLPMAEKWLRDGVIGKAAFSTMCGDMDVTDEVCKNTLADVEAKSKVPLLP